MADGPDRDTPKGKRDGTRDGEDETREHLLSLAAVRQITDAISVALAARGPHTVTDTLTTTPGESSDRW